MAVFTTQKPAPFGAITALRFVGTFESAFSAVKHWNDSRITRKALLTLTDYQLEDIGLDRRAVKNMR